MFQKIREESDLSLEVVILLILGVFMLLFGLLLFGIHTGNLPYTPDSMYGLLLVIVSLQTITMGKTPFGDLRRSWIVIVIGICTAVLGMLACFIPGYLTTIVRILIGILLFAGGIALLFQLFITEGKAKTWMKIPGVLQQLTQASAIVYFFAIVGGLITLIPGITSNPQTAVFLILYGMNLFFLSWCIHKVNRDYPPEKRKDSGITPDVTGSGEQEGLREISLPLSHAILIILAVLITLLGVLLFPVNLGLVPFSPDGQLGLLLVITAVQMMALGETPIGPYKRSWFMILIGLLFASLGIISCIVPGILTGFIRLFLGILNILGGIIPLTQRMIPIVQGIRQPAAEKIPVPPILKKLQITQTALNIVSFAFGASMLLPGLLPGMLVAGILIINGLLLFKLVLIIREIS